MASNVHDENTQLIHSCGDNTSRDSATESLNTNTSQVPGTHKHWKRPFRSVCSSQLVIILAWSFIVNCSLRLSRYNLDYPHLRLETNKQENSYAPWLTHWNDVINNMAFAISCPIAGLIAEVIVGRYKLISYSLRGLWLLSIASCVLSICEYCVPKAGHTTTRIFYVHFFLVVVPAFVLKGAFLANAIPLGIDQITDGAKSTICAFILWLVWAFNGSAYTTADVLAPAFYKCSHMEARDVSVIISLLPTLLLSIGLLIDFFLSHKLIQEPVGANPVSLIFRVMKYAAKHKFPVKRSAFTFCESELPSRLDNGKTKYGGPFTTEQVEDVKTFWRVLVIILIISSFNFPLTPMWESTTKLEKNFASSNSQTRCAEAGISSTYTPYAFITYSIPLYELLVYPCWRNSGPSILQSAGIGAAVTASLSVYGMMVETTRQVISNKTVDCMFQQNTEPTNGINHFLVGIPFNFLLAFTITILYISSFQFICAQAPYNMKGLLVGLLYMLRTIFIALGTVVYNVWREGWFKFVKTYRCGTWFYLTTLLVGAALCVLLSWLVRWYKERERDETASTQKMVEDLYYKYDKKNKNKIRSRIVSYQL